jgi:hypothetical protein
MSLAKSTLEDITIPNGTDTSRVVIASCEYFDALTLELGGPATLDGGYTYLFQTADDVNFTSNVRTIQVGDPPTDLSAPGASKFREYIEALPRSQWFRIKASGNVAADRTWKCTKTWK